MNDVHEAMKKFIVENNGFAFNKLNSLFWESVINASLELSNDNQKKAAEMLGVSRVTFKTYMDRIECETI